MKINYKALLIAILIPLGLGTIVGLSIDTDMYQNIVKPVLSPPSIVFPIVWTILYFLMGVSSYLAWQEKDNKQSLIWYTLNLILNFSWPIFFFSFKQFGVAFLILIALIFVVVKMILSFYQNNQVAAYLQIPYLLWLLFASYLNLGVYLFN